MLPEVNWRDNRRFFLHFAYNCLLFLTAQRYISTSLFLTSPYASSVCSILVKLACAMLLSSYMKSSLKLLLILAVAAVFSLVQPVNADRIAQAGACHVPDGGSTMSLLGFALLGVAALRSKLNR